MKKIILYTNEDELTRLKEFEKSLIYNAESFYFTNDKSITKYYPIKIVINIEEPK